MNGRGAGAPGHDAYGCPAADGRHRSQILHERIDAEQPECIIASQKPLDLLHVFVELFGDRCPAAARVDDERHIDRNIGGTESLYLLRHVVVGQDKIGSRKTRDWLAAIPHRHRDLNDTRVGTGGRRIPLLSSSRASARESGCAQKRKNTLQRSSRRNASSRSFQNRKSPAW